MRADMRVGETTRRAAWWRTSGSAGLSGPSPPSSQRLERRGFTGLVHVDRALELRCEDFHRDRFGVGRADSVGLLLLDFLPLGLLPELGDLASSSRSRTLAGCPPESFSPGGQWAGHSNVSGDGWTIIDEVAVGRLVVGDEVGEVAADFACAGERRTTQILGYARRSSLESAPS